MDKFFTSTFDFARKQLTSTYLISHLTSQFSRLKTKNILERKIKISNLTLDVAIGVVILIFMKPNNIANLIFDWTMVGRTSIKYLLENLITWLMGAPAGLKLNEELSGFLGNVFLYHVYIWLAYLQLLEDYLPTMLYCLAYTNILGVSLFLALLSDYINMMTFHIYCFYVYAAKLYRLQLCGLVSLSRLFMGRKWNVLRHRVDSITYEADQLIVGTILFTILLFLFPTTLMYYAVFTITRLLVLFIQTMVRMATVIIVKFPIHQFIYSDECLKNMKMQSNWKARYWYVISSVYPIKLPDVYDLTNKLASGKLVQPWRDADND